MGFELMASHLLGRQVFVSFPKENRLRNYLCYLANTVTNEVEYLLFIGNFQCSQSLSPHLFL
jgi:hypothetical protein